MVFVFFMRCVFNELFNVSEYNHGHGPSCVTPKTRYSSPDWPRAPHASQRLPNWSKALQADDVLLTHGDLIG